MIEPEEYFPELICDICGGDPEGSCVCPECPVCGTAGDPACIDNHMPRDFWPRIVELAASPWDGEPLDDW